MTTTKKAPATPDTDTTSDPAKAGNDKEVVKAAHDEAEADIESDPEMDLPDAEDDLDEGELANLGGDKNDLV